MHFYSINVLNNSYKIDTSKRVVVFKNKNQACKMIKNWMNYHNHHNKVSNIIFEVKKQSFEQLPTTQDILIINNLNKDYYPFSFVDVNRYREALEETWRDL